MVDQLNLTNTQNQNLKCLSQLISNIKNCSLILTSQLLNLLNRFIIRKDTMSISKKHMLANWNSVYISLLLKPCCINDISFCQTLKWSLENQPIKWSTIKNSWIKDQGWSCSCTTFCHGTRRSIVTFDALFSIPNNNVRQFNQWTHSPTQPWFSH